MKKHRLVIVESPYGAGGTKAVMDAGADRPGISASQIEADLIARNIAYARAAVADCIARGESPIASHLLLTQPGILDDGLHSERETGIEAGLAWYGVADACVVYGDLGISGGMQRGIERAKKLRVPIEARKLDIGSGATAQDLVDQHAPFGGSGVIQDGEVEACSLQDQVPSDPTGFSGGPRLVQAGEDILRGVPDGE